MGTSVGRRRSLAVAAALGAALCVWLSAPTTAAADGGALDLQGPDKMVLGVDASAEISALEPGDDTLRMYVNVGVLSEPTESDGRVRATYTPPATRFPQVAVVVVASDDRSIVDWLAIPLYGRPVFTLSSEPKTQVVVRVGDAEFGPIKTNRKGNAKLEIDVPPGIDEAVVVTRDRAGNEKETPRSLGVPPFQRFAIVCPDGGEHLLIVAVDETGAADPGARFDLTASSGVFEAPATRAPGVFSSRFVVADDAVHTDNSTLTVSLRGAPAFTASCIAPVPRELPNDLVMTFDRESFVAGGLPVRVSVEVLYPGKRLPQTVDVELTTEVGVVTALEAVGPTLYEATWTLPNELPGAQTATLGAHTVGSPSVQTQHALAWRPGPVARLEATVDRDTVRADGNSSVLVQVRAFDAFGNAVPRAELSARAEGRVGALAARDDGAAVAAYTAPVRYERGIDRVTIVEAASGTEASVVVTLLPISRRFTVRARIGYATNFGLVSSAVFAADVAMRLPILGRRVSVGVETGYYSSTSSQQRTDGMEEVDVAVSVFPLVARSTYELDVRSVAAYVGAGLGVLIARTRVASERSGVRLIRQPEVAVAALTGVRKQLGPGEAIVEAAYWYSSVERDGVEGNLGGLRVTGGYALDF